jgi:hypothetical protein
LQFFFYHSCSAYLGNLQWCRVQTWAPQRFTDPDIVFVQRIGFSILILQNTCCPHYLGCLLSHHFFMCFYQLLLITTTLPLGMFNISKQNIIGTVYLLSNQDAQKAIKKVSFLL